MRQFVRRSEQLVPSRLPSRSSPVALLQGKSCCSGGEHSPCTECAEQAHTSIGASLRMPGASLDGAIQRLMEERLRYSFANVRVHADEEAARSAERLDAVVALTSPSAI